MTEPCYGTRGKVEPAGMKIGITCYPTYGGSGVVATELGLELAQRGHEIHFISYAQPIRLRGEEPNIHTTKLKFHGTRCSIIRPTIWHWRHEWLKSHNCMTSIFCTCTTRFHTRGVLCWPAKCWLTGHAAAAYRSSRRCTALTSPSLDWIVPTCRLHAIRLTRATA